MSLTTRKPLFLASNNLLLLLRHYFQAVSYLYIFFGRFIVHFHFLGYQTCIFQNQCLSCEIASAQLHISRQSSLCLYFEMMAYLNPFNSAGAYCKF